ncbi:MAG: hypothetical protein JO261_11165 [Alphaproteobacteria bacterium]|nr:hypothetical protein [Alphaproteobacteria bacterium]MBV9694247.1 hypothetical protein [Alphaproteobacteria bacterium]
MNSRTKTLFLGALVGSAILGPPGGVLGAILAARVYDIRKAREAIYEGEHMPSTTEAP